jgi:hypothetical protein
MNTSHFTNNTGTSKIDISSSYVAPNATKLETSRNIAGVGFDGSGNIDIPYANLSSIPTTWGTSQIPDLDAGKITSGTFSTDRIPDLGTAKITSGTFSADRIPDLGAGKITSGTFSADRIPDLGAGKITSGTFDVLRIPDLGAGKINSGTFDVLRIPDLGAGKINSGTFDVLRIPDLGAGKINSGTFDVLRIPDLGASKINSGTFDVLRIPDLGAGKITSGTLAVGRGGTGAGTFTSGGILFGNTTSALSQSTGLTWNTGTNLLTATNIAGNGSAITSIPYENLTFKPTAGTGITITAGSSTSSPIINATASTPTSASLITILNETQFTNNTGTNKIDILDTWKPTTSTTADRLTTSVNIANVSFDGSSSISLSYLNLDNKPWITSSFAINNAYMTTSRFVKIGGTATEPAYPLNVTGDVNITGEFRKNGTIFTGGGSTFDASAITSGILPVARGGTGNASFTTGLIPFGGATSTSALLTNAYLNFTAGCLQVGAIGTATGSVRLYVGEDLGTIGTAIPRRYFNQGTALTTATGSGFGNICLEAFGSILSGSSFISTSDSRIKEDIQDINDDSALQLLLAVEPKTYKYINKVSKGHNRVYGFIAQQVREVIPDAITIRTNYIPNINLLANYNDGIITLPLQPTKVIIKVNDKIKCYNENDEGVYIEVEEVINELTFRIKPLDKPYNDNEIFIYGTQVEDFHTLEKDYIFTLNVCATQELHRRMEAQNVIIKSQDERIKELEEKVERLLSLL